MVKRTKRQQGEEPLVQCDKCSRWLYLDEAGFTGIQQAEEASPFICKLCTTVEDLHTRLHAAESEVAILRGLVEKLQVQLSDMCHRSLPSDQTDRDTQCSPNRPLPHSNAQQHEHTTHGAETERELSGVHEGAERIHNKCEEQDRMPSGIHNAIPEAKEPAIITPVETTQGNGKKQGSGDEKHSSQAKSNDLHTPHNKQSRPNKPPHNNAREVLVCGDTNAWQVANALKHLIRGKARVRVRVAKAATIAAMQRLLQRYYDRAENCNRLVVIQAGLKDAINGTQTEAAIQVLRDLVIPSTRELIVCSVPEIVSAGKEIHARTVLLNAQMRELCRDSSATFANLSKTFEKAERQLAHDVRYSPETGHEIATIVMQCARSFLGDLKPPQVADNSKRGTDRQSKGDRSLAERLTLTREADLRRRGILESARAATAQIPFLPNHAATTAQEPRVMNLPPAPTREQFHNHTPPLATVFQSKNRAIAKVGFLNMHGARKHSKWEELYQMLDAEDMLLYAVAETHLLGLEEPPVDLKWQWAGCNRAQGARKGGGVGILWRSDAGNIWTKLEGPEVLVMGDFNGHVQLIDGYQDRNGGLMLQLAERLSLEVANLRPDCIGETTWSARNSRSCIDYALTSPNLTAHMTRVHVDESGQFSLGSDHNRIALTFSASAHRVHRTDRCKSVRQYLPATSFERVAGDFEKSGIHMRQTTYAEFIDELHHTMRRYEKRDQQVKTALEARRAANRAHRNAVRSLSTEECHQAWQEFLKRKKDMQKIVQKKITESNQKQLRTITEAGRNGPQKFWAYISSLDREAPRPILRDAPGEEVTDSEEHLTAYMQQLYNSSIPVQQIDCASRKYGLLNYPETGGARCETAKGVQDHVCETERELWKSAMASKTTLRLYCDNKGTITPEPIYDNLGRSALLFEARAGALRTLDCAPEVQAAVCRVCGSERETAEHLVLNCAKLSPTPKEGTTMPQALGFLDAEGGRCFEGVATTKARLERWWRAVKQSRTVPAAVHRWTRNNAACRTVAHDYSSTAPSLAFNPRPVMPAHSRDQTWPLPCAAAENRL
ncbi:hypothetical protein HPB49_023977 [Dermacentor silvarum]|uniref:Uncharacterized protein n=1 Tax=Dermacentor silvarum TaxID=543639 RepID=A0ACB8D0M2_DERSI|nr:hypothetical protein HPB49_023977 [Dermacentor silvarum]